MAIFILCDCDLYNYYLIFFSYEKKEKIFIIKTFSLSDTSSPLLKVRSRFKFIGTYVPQLTVVKRNLQI